LKKQLGGYCTEVSLCLLFVVCHLHLSVPSGQLDGIYSFSAR